MSTFNPANTMRAAEANMDDAARTTADIEALIAWHEKQQAVHASAIQTLAKARAASNAMANLHRIEAANLKLKMEKENAQ